LNRIFIGSHSLLPLWFAASVLHAPAGVAFEALQEHRCSCKVFSQRLSVCEVLVLAGLGGAMRTYRHPSVFSARPGSVAMRRAPKPGPTQGDRGKFSVLSVRPFAVLLQDRGVRHPRLPSHGLRIADCSFTPPLWFAASVLQVVSEPVTGLD
jgi:hypothetical protein